MLDKSPSIKELAAALSAFQAEVDAVKKDAENPFFKSKYASLENVIATIKPLLAKHGLAYTQFPSLIWQDAHPQSSLTTILLHTSGEWLQATTPLLMKDQTPQGQGSAITYMRRYALAGVLGLATEEDDDGNAASKPVKITKPAVVVKAEEKEANEKKEIQKLCDEMSDVPLLDKREYVNFIKGKTGLIYGEAKNGEIIERLTALKN